MPPAPPAPPPAAGRYVLEAMNVTTKKRMASRMLSFFISFLLFNDFKPHFWEASPIHKVRRRTVDDKSSKEPSHTDSHSR
jgi:hypothetical protein